MYALRNKEIEISYHSFIAQRTLEIFAICPRFQFAYVYSDFYLPLQTMSKDILVFLYLFYIELESSYVPAVYTSHVLQTRPKIAEIVNFSLSLSLSLSLDLEFTGRV